MQKNNQANQRVRQGQQNPQYRRRKKNVRKRRKVRSTRWIRAILVVLLVLGLIGMVLLFATDQVVEKTTRVYPMEYTDLICHNADEFGLEPAYVAAVILAESSYNPNAVSSVNAQGLMQIMPETGQWIAHKLGETYVEGCLFDPATNVRYGCWYLGFLMDRYNGDKTCSSAAYHSGQGTVDKWLQDPAYSSDGQTLNIIAGPNADTYVKRILEYYEKYVQLYAKEIAL